MLIIGIPTYDNTINAYLAGGLINESGLPDTPKMVVMIKSLSILTQCFNALWSFALNNRKDFTRFMMIHADVVPARGFVKAMLDEMDATQADILSVAMPIKDGRGLTSTALLRDARKATLIPEREKRRRVTMHELESLPETFGVEDVEKLYGYTDKRPVLMVNTGLMLVDMSKPWCQNVHFRFQDAIFLNEQGIYYADVIPEDWLFSCDAAERGAKILCTRKVKARHLGKTAYPNDGGWGDLKSDTEQKAEAKSETAL